MNRTPGSRSPRLVLAAVSLSLALLAVGWRENRRQAPVLLVPTLTGEPEYCLTCHQDLPEISASHPVATFGCVRCHGGEPLALDADLAHASLRGGRNPSDLTVVEASCGGSECHSGPQEAWRDHIPRVMTSLQATYAGGIAGVRYAFGAQKDPTAELGIFAVQDPDLETAGGLPGLERFDPSRDNHPALATFAENCLTCHISAQPRSGLSYARETGCAACHGVGSSLANEAPVHTLTTAIPYTQCNTCHNRGNYSLRQMAFQPRSDRPEGRLQAYYQPIAQFTRCEVTLDCIDCHTRDEVMGDGDLHSYQDEVQYIQCQTCHGTLDRSPLTMTLDDPDELALQLAFLNPVLDLQVGDTILVTERGEPMWNTRQVGEGRFELVSKASGEHFVFRTVQGTACQQDVSQQDSRFCHECHAVER